ncbi:hypothetical protein ACTFIY_000631 [Dictyostelium cf. discoideum]
MGYLKNILYILIIFVFAVKSSEVSKYKAFSISGPGCDSSLKINLNDATCSLNCGVYLSIEQSQRDQDTFKSRIYSTIKQSSESKQENSSEFLSSDSHSSSDLSSDSLSSETTPEPTTPGPSTPEPTTPGPSTPEPTTPGPSTPEPSTPGPSTPEPATPGPSTPAPAEPAPAEPAPAEPAPAEPAPAEPAPAEPAPAATVPSENLVASLTNCISENKLGEVDIVCSDKPSTFTILGQQFSVTCFENSFIDENEQDGSNSSKTSIYPIVLLNY